MINAHDVYKDVNMLKSMQGYIKNPSIYLPIVLIDPNLVNLKSEIDLDTNLKAQFFWPL